MADQKLTDRISLDTSTDSDVIHVVNNDVSYKQTKANLLKEDRSRITNLEDNQVTGVVQYSTLAELPTTGTLNVSYKVTNDSTSSNNGYYHWNGSTYIKDANLANGVVESGNVDAVSGNTVGVDAQERINNEREQLIATDKGNLTTPYEVIKEINYSPDNISVQTLQRASWRFKQDILIDKTVNEVVIPIVRDIDNSEIFESTILVKVGKNDKWIYEYTIPVSDLSHYNLLTRLSDINDFDYRIQIPNTYFEVGDNINVAVECSGTDTIGYTYNDTVNNGIEGGNDYYVASYNYGEVKAMFNPDDSWGNLTQAPRLGANFNRYDIAADDLTYTRLDQYDLLKETDFLVDTNGCDITNNEPKITPLSINRIGGTLDTKTAETWYKWVSDKTLNTISIPLMRSGNYTGVFTEDVELRVAVNNVFILNRTITLAEIVEAGLNSTSSINDDVYLTVQLPVIEIKENDLIYIGIECGGTDEMGFVYTSDTSGEWGDRYYLRTENDISTYINVPDPSGATDFALCVKFGYNNYIKEQINGNCNPNAVLSISSRDENSFIGGTNTVIDYLLAAKPRAKFCFISHHTIDGIDGDKSLVKLIEAQQSLANYWGVPLLRLDNKLGWVNRNGVNTLLANVPDELHPGTDTTLDAIRQYKVQCVEFLKQFYVDYTGLKVAWYGTSIPYGHPTNDLSTRYPDQSVTELGGTCLNKSWPGSHIRRYKFDGSPTSVDISFLDVTENRNYQQDMVDLIGTADEPDLFVFDFGINDFVTDDTDFDFDNNIN